LTDNIKASVTPVARLMGEEIAGGGSVLKVYGLNSFSPRHPVEDNASGAAVPGGPHR
jgi:hypothetical protein